MTPVLVTPPASDPVSLAEVKAHLRVDHTDDDAMIGALIKSAVAHLDGRAGVLGRCMMAQTWSVEVDGAGDVTLPFPDVTSASADYGDGPVALTVTASATGPVVEVMAAGTVTFSCAMPASLLPAAQVAIKFLVELAYDRPEGPAFDALDRAIDSVVTALRWRQV